MKRSPKHAVIHGHIGLWQLEANCGARCGHCDLIGKPRHHSSADILARAALRQKFCPGVDSGKPNGRCGWPLTYGWLFVPWEKS